jgi:hypothetical protein
MNQRKLVRDPTTGALQLSQIIAEEAKRNSNSDEEQEVGTSRATQDSYLSTNLILGVPSTLADI